MSTLLKPAERSQAYFKAGFFGFEGSGKTFSAALTAIGLHRFIKSKKPVAFYDSETGSDYVLHLFEYAKIKLLAVKSRALKDLGATIREAQKEVDIILVDSLTHPYKELCSSYIRSKKDGTKFIRMQDWQIIKDAWSVYFADPYVNSQLHFIWCSRAKNVFEEVLDVEASEQAQKEIYKTIQTGTGARSETESAYEPSILVEFTRELLDESLKSKKTGIYRRKATVLKERFGILDGMEAFFTTPIIVKNSKSAVDYKQLIDVNDTFQFFLPHIERLNLGGKHVGFDQEAKSDDIFEDKEGKERWTRKTDREILIEKIKGEFESIMPGSTAQAKKFKVDLSNRVFETKSWLEIEKRMDYDKLERGYNVLSAFAPVFEAYQKDCSTNGIDIDIEEVWTKLDEVKFKVQSEEGLEKVKEREKETSDSLPF